jgi:hypothetical protein
MLALVRIAEGAAEAEESGFPLAITLAGTVFVLFVILLIAVTRLNLDR